ncbi:cytochrome P450 family protein [Mycobacterium xenopi 3993]|nr:cytochrome P450 family protein [Mycobacterium xenopi 3993]
MYAFLMMLGGMDTTSGFTGNVLLRLCQDPLLRRQLIADPELIKKGTDELLRLYSPTLGLARTVSRDAEFHGQPLCAGDRAILMWERPTETRRCSRIPTRLIWPGRMPRSTWHLVSACIAASARTMPR